MTTIARLCNCRCGCFEEIERRDRLQNISRCYDCRRNASPTCQRPYYRRPQRGKFAPEPVAAPPEANDDRGYVEEDSAKIEAELDRLAAIRKATRRWRAVA